MKKLLSYALLGCITLALGVVGCADDPASSNTPIDPTTSSKIVPPPPNAQLVQNSWIVLFNDDMANVPAVVSELSENRDMVVTNVYQYAIKGFAARMSKETVQELAADPRVVLIENDQMMFTATQTVDWGIGAIGADVSSAVSGNGSGTVTGVQIYILDTGIDLDHPDLNVDSAASRNYTNDASPDDGHGHGTHCAGIAAAMDNTSFTVGAAPGAQLIAVKVLSNTGSGYNSWVMAGLDYVVARKGANSTMPMVASLSLGGPTDAALDRTIANTVNADIVVCVAAGNSNADASTSSPARAPSAITVGAYGSNNALASFSNYGRLVDINAPGVAIFSTYKNGGTATLSGTSMACPYVAGSAALYLSTHPTETPINVRNQLVLDAKAKVSVPGRKKTTNRSVYVGTY